MSLLRIFSAFAFFAVASIALPTPSFAADEDDYSPIESSNVSEQAIVSQKISRDLDRPIQVGVFVSVPNIFVRQKGEEMHITASRGKLKIKTKSCKGTAHVRFCDAVSFAALLFPLVSICNQLFASLTKQLSYKSSKSKSTGAEIRSSMIDFSTRSINGLWFSFMAWITAFFKVTGTLSRGQADTDRAAMPMACS